MAEGARLESVFTGNCDVGSNPTLSASFCEVLRSAQDFGSRLGRRESASSSNPTLSAIPAGYGLFWADIAILRIAFEGD